MQICEENHNFEIVIENDRKHLLLQTGSTNTEVIMVSYALLLEVYLHVYVT